MVKQSDIFRRCCGSGGDFCFPAPSPSSSCAGIDAIIELNPEISVCQESCRPLQSGAVIPHLHAVGYRDPPVWYSWVP